MMGCCTPRRMPLRAPVSKEVTTATGAPTTLAAAAIDTAAPTVLRTAETPATAPSAAVLSRYSWASKASPS
ncbi:Uncharacterised protein [Bordetella pertussis]|nr:Uncharacterised protein [Bordetella pertussis]CFP02636.1 Uncharacterised protein [Bordetella pertussis]CFW38579.1 Uncharacterised protein [Bordetella pertussis]